MSEVWKKATLLSFGPKRKVAMNGLISWHLWTNATIDNTCVKCTNINMEELHYTNQVIEYDMSKYKIESLKEGTYLMGELQKVGCVVLKSGFIIKQRSPLENALYDLNVDTPSDKSLWFGIDKNKHHMYYKQSFNNHDIMFFEKNTNC